ncbi:substrate-binding periplasmic protein [Undibacterium sp. Ji22W]|uniref:substrate-binding periplasmic protein n=1 Tax=Undibacterium sp. Ji22W TaxID=3413038 RepID=UPI003BF13C68
MMKHSLRFLACFTFFCAATEAVAADTLKLLYEIREPMAYRDSRGKLTGLAITPVTQAMNSASISYAWVETPFKRQLNLVEANDEAVCAVGMFKNKERQKFAKFTFAILRDTNRPSIMLTHKDFQPDKNLDLMHALSLPGIKMLKKDNASYGSVLDDAIERSHVTVVTTTAESKNMAMMIAAKRADFIFVPEEEALNMIKSIPNGDQLHIFKPLGMPQGPERFLMCSQLVSDELIQKFNKALSK